MMLSSSIVRTLRLRMMNWPSTIDGLDVGRLTVVDPRGHDAPRRHEVGPLRVEDDEVGLLPDLERAEELRLAARLAHPPCVASSSMSSGCGRTPGIASLRGDAFRQQRDPHDLEQVVGVVVGAVGDRAARPRAARRSAG